MDASERMRERMLTKAAAPNGDVPAPTRRMVLRSIAGADLLYLAFPRLQRALVVDLRQPAADGPAVFTTELLFASGREIAMIEARRPRLTAIDRFASVTWGGSTRAFAEQGILPAILNRLPAEQTTGAMAVFEELSNAERAPEPRETRARTPGRAVRDVGQS
jgi:hypothetical protein